MDGCSVHFMLLPEVLIRTVKDRGQRVDEVGLSDSEKSGMIWTQKSRDALLLEMAAEKCP